MMQFSFKIALMLFDFAIWIHNAKVIYGVS
jgi:hypothetical protein